MKRFKTAYIPKCDSTVAVCGWLQDTDTGAVEDLFCTGISEEENRLLLNTMQPGGGPEGLPESIRCIAGGLRAAGCGISKDSE